MTNAILMALFAETLLRLFQVLQLVFQDIALSGDNQTVLTELAQKLEEESAPPWPFNHYRWGDQQMAVLMGGLIVACVARIIALAIAQVLLHVTIENTVIVAIAALQHVPVETFSTTNLWLLFLYKIPIFGVLGGGFLIKAGIVAIVFGEGSQPHGNKKHTFWSVFIEIVKFDLILSVDNVISASEVSHDFGVIAFGVAFAIFLLIYAAPYMLGFLRQFPLMSKNVYYLILAIGIELLIDSCAIAAPKFFGSIGLQHGIPDAIKIGVAVSIIGGTILWSLYKRQQQEEGVERIFNFQPIGPVVDGFIRTSDGKSPGEYLVTLARADEEEFIHHKVNNALLIAVPRSRGPALDRWFGRYGKSLIEKEIAALADVIASKDDDGRVAVLLICTDDGHGVLPLGEFTATELKNIHIDPEALDLTLGTGRYMMDGIYFAEKILLQPDVTFMHMTTLFYRSAWDQQDIENWRINTAQTMANDPHAIDEQLLVFWQQGIEDDMKKVDSLPTGVDVDTADVQEYHSVAGLRKVAPYIGKELVRTNNTRVIHKKGKISADGRTLKEGSLKVVEKGSLPIGVRSFKVEVPGKETFSYKW